MYKVCVTREVLSPKMAFTVGKTFELPFSPFHGLELIYRTEEEVYSVFLDECEISWDTDVKMFFVKLPEEYYSSDEEAKEVKKQYQIMGWDVR